MIAAATSAPTTAVYFQIRRRCGRAGGSTRELQSCCGLPVDLVGPDDHFLRHPDAEPRGRREVDRELGGWNFVDGQLRRRSASQDAVHVPGTGLSDRGEVDP